MNTRPRIGKTPSPPPARRAGSCEDSFAKAEPNRQEAGQADKALEIQSLDGFRGMRYTYSMSTGFRFRAYPDDTVAGILPRWIGSQRFIKNAKVREDRYFLAGHSSSASSISQVSYLKIGRTK